MAKILQQESGITRPDYVTTSALVLLQAIVTGNVYLAMLQNFAIGQFLPGSVFQQAGAPLHHQQVREFLGEKFPDGWIGRRGPLAWPPRSPDVTPLDLFFLGLCEGCYVPKRQS
ncbi:hypothetical protein ANN_00681 [Periplaneta americana]|uniref:Uncharacterized protein n=1 Tax=Periplaneta americana TaxID=6978 RepID=A0ABQ8TTV4_PERAM|nr:hypothetical protein ANN_00681 [Periplaneta americana]